ncbi:TasA family protein [Scopulibacillus cellulosilyticus]|uniref:TasA family protein n=1 Tax=Scopulibacillus cellulosilyticus TaxID=2665665 RepID=A0ABW2PYM5_9BACL
MKIRSKISGALLSLGLGAALMIVGTFALFSDHVISPNNSFAAGTLDLKVNGQDTTVQGINATGITPGDVNTQSFKVQNAGSLDFFYRIVPSNLKITLKDGTSFQLTDDKGTFNQSAYDNYVKRIKADGESGDHLQIKVAGQSFLDSNGGISTHVTKLSPSQTDNIDITYGLDKDAGNAYQGIKVQSDLYFDAVQAKNNDTNGNNRPDSWG